MAMGGWAFPGMTWQTAKTPSHTHTQSNCMYLWDGIKERGLRLTRPMAVLTGSEDGLKLGTGSSGRMWKGNPLLHLDAALAAAFEAARSAGYERPCFAGAFHYDLRRCVEAYASPARDDLGLPWITGAVFGAAEPFSRADLEGWTLRAPAPPHWSGESMSRAAYEDGVRIIVELEHAGEVYQVNLTRQLAAACSSDPLVLWARMALRARAPFSAFFDAGSFQVLSLSPERFLRRSGSRLWTEPIKGTVPRGATPEEDAANLARLLSSEKDAAELAMIVDVERNDLGRVALPGSVRVEGHREVISLPNVHHLASTVGADLRAGTGLADILRATFPGGSVTGAPKIRAMQIIDELEPVSRGFYCGALGWMDPNGDFDLSLTIRTATAKDGRLHLGAGGGIVVDSDPASEWEETVAKARCFVETRGDG